MEGPKIFAVAVTYKRAEILTECLNAVLNLSTFKIHHLHLVVNHEEKATMKVIKQFQEQHWDKISYEVHDNCGPAGGFYYGLKRFLASSCEYVWLMDDDIIPEPTCLTELVRCTKDNPYVFSTVLTRQGQQLKAFGWWGVLISKGIVEHVGLPIKDFFYWTEDTEYLQNRMIRENNFIPFRCDEAVVTHLHQRNHLKPDWYYYYTTRNTLHYRMRIFPLNYRGVRRLGNMFLGAFYRITFKERNKTRKFNNLFLGVRDGLRGKLGKIKTIH